jgi:hypothetical protein
MDAPMKFKVMRDVKFLSFFLLNVEHLDEMPSHSSCGIASKRTCSLLLEVSIFHVIFNLNGVLMATRFAMVQNIEQQKPSIPFHILILKPGLKEFLEWCIVQFVVYIWSTTQQHNINKYLDQI